MLGWFFLRQAGLDKEGKQLIMSQCKDNLALECPEEAYYGEEEEYPNYNDSDGECLREQRGASGFDSEAGHYNDADNMQQPDQATCSVDEHDDIMATHTDAWGNMNDMRLAGGFYPVMVATQPPSPPPQSTARVMFRGSGDRAGGGPKGKPAIERPANGRGNTGSRKGRTSPGFALGGAVGSREGGDVCGKLL